MKHEEEGVRGDDVLLNVSSLLNDAVCSVKLRCCFYLPDRFRRR